MVQQVQMLNVSITGEIQINMQWDITSYLLGWLLSEEQKITRAHKDGQKLEHLYTVGRNV